MKAFALAVAAPIGFYDGFFDPERAHCLRSASSRWPGLGLLQATANTKVLNLTSNLVSLCVFVVTGHIVYAIGLPMALVPGGGRLGRHTHGHDSMASASFVRCSCSISVAVALRLLFDRGNPVGHWLRAQLAF